MNGDGQQPARHATDGPVSVHRIGDAIVITAKQGSIETHLELSEFNAWRIFAMLATMLEIKLPTALLKRIKLG